MSGNEHAACGWVGMHVVHVSSSSSLLSLHRSPRERLAFTRAVLSHGLFTDHAEYDHIRRQHPILAHKTDKVLQQEVTRLIQVSHACCDVSGRA